MLLHPSKPSILIIIAIVAIAGGLLVREVNRPADEAETVHIHAAFHVYRDGVLQDFTDLKYMSVKPCSEDEHEEALSPENELLERAHLHDGVGDVVHIHRPAVTWRALFENIGYEVPADAGGYVDGAFVENILQKEVRAYERVIIYTGELRDPALKHALVPDRARIETVEAQSELCGT